MTPEEIEAAKEILATTEAEKRHLLPLARKLLAEVERAWAEIENLKCGFHWHYDSCYKNTTGERVAGVYRVSQRPFLPSRPGDPWRGVLHEKSILDDMDKPMFPLRQKIEDAQRDVEIWLTGADPAELLRDVG